MLLLLRYRGAPWDTLQSCALTCPIRLSLSFPPFDHLTVFMNFGSEASCAPSSWEALADNSDLVAESQNFPHIIVTSSLHTTDRP